MLRKTGMILLTLAALFALAFPAWAGGWAVVTLDELPSNAVTGQPLAIGFVVRQHGVTLLPDLEPYIVGWRPDTGESFSLIARPQAEVGHYATTLTFPSAGKWEWSIDAFGGFVQPMPTLNVLPSDPNRPASDLTSSKDITAGTSIALPIVLGLAGVAATLGGLIALVRTRSGWAAAVMLAAAMIAGLGFVSAGNRSSPGVALAAPDSSPVEVGQALFLAKGCVMCHQHAAVSEARKNFAEFSIGPNLTTLSAISANPDFLRRWLKDPSAVKPGTEMPTLGLSEAEIEALIAFLTAEQ